MAQTTTMTLVEFLGLRLDEDEARMLREVEAKRAIVAQWKGWATGPPDDLPVDGSARFTLRALAAVYADHPSYDASWRP